MDMSYRLTVMMTVIDFVGLFRLFLNDVSNVLTSMMLLMLYENKIFY